MKTPALIHKAKLLFTIWKTPPSPPFCEVRRTLTERIFEHLSAYADLQLLLKLGTPIDRLPEGRSTIREARRLAADIAAIPNFREIDPLWEAHQVLIQHWRGTWSNGGISSVAYRSALKALVLFLRNYA